MIHFFLRELSPSCFPIHACMIYIQVKFKFQPDTKYQVQNSLVYMNIIHLITAFRNELIVFSKNLNSLPKDEANYSTSQFFFFFFGNDISSIQVRKQNNVPLVLEDGGKRTESLKVRVFTNSDCNLNFYLNWDQKVCVFEKGYLTKTCKRKKCYEMVKINNILRANGSSCSLK